MPLDGLHDIVDAFMEGGSEAASRGRGCSKGRTVEFVARVHAAWDDRHVLDDGDCPGTKHFPEHPYRSLRDAQLHTADQHTGRQARDFDLPTDALGEGHGRTANSLDMKDLLQCLSQLTSGRQSC